MTDMEIVREFERLEREANARTEGADYYMILQMLAGTSGRSVAEVRRLVLDNTFMPPN